MECTRFKWIRASGYYSYDYVIFDPTHNQAYGLIITSTLLSRTFRYAELFVTGVPAAEQTPIFKILPPDNVKASFDALKGHVKDAVEDKIRQYSKKCECKECD